MIEGGDEIAVDNWPVLIGNCDSRTAKGIMRDIGWVEGLCDRGGLASTPSVHGPLQHEVEPQPGLQHVSSSLAPAINTAPERPQIEELPPAPSPIASYQDAALEKSRLLKSTYGTNGSTFHVANPSSNDESRYVPSSASSPSLPAPAAIRTSFAPLPSAEEEKRNYYEQATRQRDTLQSSARGTDSFSAPSPASADHRYSDSLHSPSVEEDPVSLQRAAIVHRESRDELSRPVPARAETDRTGLRSSQYVESGPTFATAHLAPTRSNTIMALSGSDVSVSPPSVAAAPPHAEPTPPPPPPREQPTSPAALLGRSLTTAEAEKRRLFLDAKEMARKRQEEARLELERQNQALAELEFEEAQLAYEARLIAEAEEERREVERLAREAFEADRLERIRRDEERWRREEEERQAQARHEMEEKRRRAEEAMKEELRRFEAHHAEAERARAAEIERQAEERKREDDAKRAMAEEMRRLDEERAREEQERKSAAARKVEMERQRADAERRRQEGEQARLADLARRQAAEAAEAQRRFAEEERLAQVRAEEEERAQRRYEEEERQRLRHDEDERRRAHEAEARRVQQSSEGSSACACRSSFASPFRVLTLSTRSDGHSEAYSVSAFPSPPPNGRTTSYGSGVHRAPSVASFAPSTSAANATAEFYAQAIGQQTGLSDEKARYLAQLRERRAHVASPGPYGSPSPQRSYQDAAALQPAYPQGAGYPRAPQPQPPVHPLCNAPAPTRQDSYMSNAAPNAPPKPPLPPHTASSASVDAPGSSSTTPYKTAAEEKEEAAARRRAEDAAAAARRREEDDRGKQPAAPPPAAAPEDDEAPPSYPVPAQGGSSSSAAAEKAELERCALASLSGRLPFTRR